VLLLLLVLLLLALLVLLLLLLLPLLLLLLLLLLLRRTIEALSCVAWAMMSSKSSLGALFTFLDFPGIDCTSSICRKETK
jgi:hypothetical protein